MNTVITPWQDSCSSITRALKYMLNKEILVDAIFKKDRVNCLYAHKLVLSIWSPKLADWIAERDKREMFSITFDEDVNVLKILLQYLYSPDDDNCFSKMPMEKLIQALEISERYEISHVYKKCLSSLRHKKINPSNVIKYFDYGLRKNLNNIFRKCVKVLENEGINIKDIKEDFSLIALINLLSLQKIATSSEADLLCLAISWLSCPDNERYKHRVLSFIDLQSINYTEYQDICKRYPHFFTDAELSSIILSKLRQDPKLLPKWYKPKIKSTVEYNCSLCIYVYKKMKISMPEKSLKINKRKNLKSVTQEFGFQFYECKQVDLLNVELNFGPEDISPKEFILQFSLSRTVPEKEYYVGTTKGNDRYKIFFKSPLRIKSKDTLTLKLNFRRGLLANNIHLFWPILVQDGMIQYGTAFSASNEDVLKIDVTSSKLAFYLTDDNIEKFILSSFYLNICDDHRPFLSRRSLESGNISSMIKMDPEFENTSGEIPEKVHVKEEMVDIKMDIDDERPNDDNDVTSKLTSIKMEDITLDSSNEIYHTALQIVAYDGMAYIKQELIDLTDDL